MNQRELIKKHLEIFGSITPLEALREYGCFRLAARIGELKETCKISSKTITEKNRFGKSVKFSKYSLVA